MSTKHRDALILITALAAIVFGLIVATAPLRTGHPAPGVTPTTYGPPPTRPVSR